MVLTSEQLKRVSAFIRKARLALDMTQQEVAQLYGYTKGNVSGWESGRHLPKTEVIADLSSRSGLPHPLQDQDAANNLWMRYLAASFDEKLLIDLLLLDNGEDVPDWASQGEILTSVDILLGSIRRSAKGQYPGNHTPPAAQVSNTRQINWAA